MKKLLSNFLGIQHGIWKGEGWESPQCISSNLIIFCYKNLKNSCCAKFLTYWKSVTVYSEPTASEYVNIRCSYCLTTHSKCKHRQYRENLWSKFISHILFLNHSIYILNKTRGSHFSLKSFHKNEKEHCTPIARALYITSNENFLDEALLSYESFSTTISAFFWTKWINRYKENLNNFLSKNKRSQSLKITEK